MLFIRYVIPILMVMTVIFMTPAYAEDPSPVAKVSMLKSKVQLKSTKQDWHDININENLYINDQIRVMKNSFAEITFLNTGTKLRLSDFSQITIENQSNDVKLSFGKLFMAVVKGKGGMKVNSPAAVAAVLGTVGLVSYDPITTDKTKLYNVTSLDGNFAVTDNAGNTVNVPAGNQVDMTPDGLVTSVADVMNIIKSSQDVLQGQFIKVGLDAEHIRIDPITGQEVIRLDTANPKEQIEINVETGKTDVIELNLNGADPVTDHTTDNPTVQPDPTPPAIPVTNTMGQINNSTSVINLPTYNVPVTVF